MKSYYSLLGVAVEATLEVVREAFLRKALAAHPDRGGSEASLQDVMRAFETLSDPHSREEYDRSLAGLPSVAVAARPRERQAFQKPHASIEDLGEMRHYDQSMAEDNPRESKVFGRLYKLLRSLPREHRHVALAQQFTESQRRSFERWILTQKLHRREGMACEIPVVTKRCRHDSNYVPRKTRCHSIVRINRQGSRYRYYFASVVMEGLQVLSKTSSDLEMVLKFHSALVLIKHRVARGGSIFAANFRYSLRQTLEECGLDARTMGLKLRVSLRVLWLSSALRTATYLVPSQLEEGLEAHRRLLSARGHVDRHRSNILRNATPEDISLLWTGLRREFLSVMSAAGQLSPAVALRLEALEMEQRACQERQSERWNRAQMAKEERISRQQVSFEACQRSKRLFSTSRVQPNRKNESITRAENTIQKLLLRSCAWKRPRRQCEKIRWSKPCAHKAACCRGRRKGGDNNGTFASPLRVPSVDKPRRRRKF